MAIALVAAVISLVSLYRTGRLQRQQMRLHIKQEELIDLQLESLKKQSSAPNIPQQEKADVRITLEQHGQGHRFVIINWARVPARDVNFELRPKEGRNTPLVQGDYDEKLPIPELSPGGRCTLLAALTFGTGTAFNGKWTWRNPDGSVEMRSSILTL